MTVRYALAALVLAAVLAPPAHAGAPPFQGMQRAPAFSIPAAAGNGTIQLAQYDGWVRVINLWAPWCGPCKKELPDLVRLNRTYRAKKAVVIGVALAWDKGPEVLPIARAAGVDYPLGLGTAAVEAAYGVEAFPTTVVVGRHGFIYRRYRGTRSYETLAKDIQDLM